MSRLTEVVVHGSSISLMAGGMSCVDVLAANVPSASGCEEWRHAAARHRLDQQYRSFSLVCSPVLSVELVLRCFKLPVLQVTLRAGNCD